MTDKTTPEWQAFRNEVKQAVADGLLGADSSWILAHAPSIAAACASFEVMKREYSEYRLLRDMWQAERDARRRWWITALIAALSVGVVAMAVYLS